MKDYKELKEFRDVPAEEFRKPMLIHEYLMVRQFNWAEQKTTEYIYPECPRCGRSVPHDYQRFCSCCGQRLKWNFAKMKCRKVVGNGK